MTVKLRNTSRAIVTETYSESSDEEFSSQDDDAQLAHAVEDLPAENATFKKDKHSLGSHAKEEKEEEEEEQDDDDCEGDATEDSEGASESDGNNEDDGGDGEDINSGWVDSIAKILKTNKPKKKKTLVLSKAKKLNDPPKAKPKAAGFQVEKEDGVISEEQITPEADKKQKEEGPPRKRKRDVQCLRIKPNVIEKDRERLLSKIATKGVVQLFNAVKQQQKDIKTKLDQAGPLEVKRDKVLKSIDKRSFLDHLMGDKGKSVGVGAEAKGVKNELKSTEPTWSVLRDDFMMGSNKMKDWDKQLEAQDEEETLMEVEQEMESD